MWEKIFAVVMIPLVVLNFAGGIVAGIWLAFLGEWGIIGWGVASLFFSTWLLNIAFMPGLLLVAPGIVLGQRSKTVFVAFAFLGAAYQAAVITAWCMGVLYFFMQRAHSSSAFIPIVLWSYGVATGPLSYMAAREARGGGGDAAAISSFFAQIGFVVTVIAGAIFNMTFLNMAYLFGAFMAVGVLGQLAFAVEKMRMQSLWM